MTAAAGKTVSVINRLIMIMMRVVLTCRKLLETLICIPVIRFGFAT